MAIGCDRPAACTEIVVGRGSISGHRPIGINPKALGELVLERYCEHVGNVVGMRSRSEVGSGNASGRGDGGVVVLPRIAGRTECMGPAKIQADGSGQWLTQREPSTQPLTLVLEFQILRDVAMQRFENTAKRCLRHC